MRPARAVSLLALAALLLGTGLASGELAQEGNVRLRFDAEIAPTKLPREGTAPISVSLQGKIATADGSKPPALRRFEIALNRTGRLNTRGLQSCRLHEIQPASTANAMRACGEAKVGTGSFSAAVLIPEQSPFPSDGRVTAFNGTQGGRPVIFAHVYGAKPVPTSFTLLLRVSRERGRFGTVLRASLPNVTSDVAVVEGISLTLGRRYRAGGERRSYLSAGCPAPRGFPGAVFPLARARFAFAGGRTLESTLVRNCRARG